MVPIGPGLDLVPSAIALAGAEIELATIEGRERRVRRLLQPIAERYDLILIDCPPSLGLLTVNALTAADSVLIPLQSEYYALEGLTQLIATIDLVRDHLHPSLAIDGVVLTMADGGPTCPPRSPPRRADISAASSTRRSSRAACACPRRPSHGLPIDRYAPGSRGADAYAALAEEFRARRAARTRPEAVVA